MNKILIWVLTYDFFATLPSDVKLFLNRMSEDFYKANSPDGIQELSNTYELNGSVYDYFIGGYASRYGKIQRKLEAKPDSNDQYLLFQLCDEIRKARSSKLITVLDEEDRKVFRAFMVYLINRQY